MNKGYKNCLKLSLIPAFLLIVALTLGACNNTKYLAKGETLYTGSEVTVHDTLLSKGERNAMAESLQDIIHPKPNRSFLGLRFRLLMYNWAGHPKNDWGFKHWLKTKIGEPPVLGQDLNTKLNAKIFENYLQNIGYFSVKADGEKQTQKKRTTAIFNVSPGIQDTIHSVTFEKVDSAVISRKVYATRNKTLLRKGYPYNLGIIKTERERIAQQLQNEGYFYFNPDFIIIEADSAVGHHSLDLYVRLKWNEMPRKAFYRYKINKVTIYSNYQMMAHSENEELDALSEKVRLSDTAYYGDYAVIDGEHLFKPKTFYPAVQLKPGDYYNIGKQDIALNRLVNMNAFRFVKNEFKPAGDSSKHLLNLNYYLSPYPKKTLSAHINGYTQDDDRIGSRIGINWENHNTFRGGEIFSVGLTAGVDMQYGGEVSAPNIYTFGLKGQLLFPRYLVPFYIKPPRLYVPKTIIEAEYNYSLGKDYYKITTLSAGYGYIWKESAAKEHHLYLAKAAYVKTDTLNISNANQLNLNSLTFNGLLLGPQYEYTYNSRLNPSHRGPDNYYFDGKIDLSGNIIGWAQGAALDKETKTFLGLRYAQYAKLQADFRYYHNYTSEKMLAARVFMGFGLPYGNSRSLPNIKQFFSGGSNSLRGFASRLVGPGTYHYSSTTNNNVYIEMLGDLKLEMNLEYRFPIYRFIKGGVFADAGNVWLYRKNPELPGGVFTSDFYKQLAVDVGAGLRLDFSILVLRLDFGIPIRKPWYPQGKRWRLGDISFANGGWRHNNLFFNLSIGYPF